MKLTRRQRRPWETECLLRTLGGTLSLSRCLPTPGRAAWCWELPLLCIPSNESPQAVRQESGKFSARGWPCLFLCLRALHNVLVLMHQKQSLVAWTPLPKNPQVGLTLFLLLRFHNECFLPTKFHRTSFPIATPLLSAPKISRRPLYQPLHQINTLQ